MLKLSDTEVESLQILEKKVVEELIGAAYSISDHLGSFPHFCHNNENVASSYWQYHIAPLSSPVLLCFLHVVSLFFYPKNSSIGCFRLSHLSRLCAGIAISNEGGKYFLC